jgi:spore maturation protein CgeB
MSEIYSQSKLGFNYSIFNELNMRFFEIMSSGTMLLTNPIKECNIEKLGFRDGEHLRVYHNPKELFALIDYYLSHDQERELIAQKGYNMVISKHTYDNRVREMLEYIHGFLRNPFGTAKDAKSC